MEIQNTSHTRRVRGGLSRDRANQGHTQVLECEQRVCEDMGVALMDHSIITNRSCAVKCPAESQELYFCSVQACLDLFYHKPNWYFSNLSIQ